ncbi:Disease resistance protein RPM1 [Dichanthelium oligosanthes]|uniref:Disease resistance protein RPM1 n=1 Tax=Dichanthelium oligosanthes TaxID=888268 RepID=A0A1E5WHL4_9POAL|nr:Disease resistance protein RPM1 [Dichanthelium oligosanthes]
MIAVSLSAKVAASFAKPAAVELSSLFAIRSGVADAARELELLRVFLRFADSRRGTDALTAAWINQVRAAAFELEDVADEYSFLSGQGFIRDCGNFGAWFALSRRLRKARARLRELSAAKEQYRILPADTSVPRLVQSRGDVADISVKVAEMAHFLGEEEIVGFGAHRRLLVEWLTKDAESRRTLVAVWGMGGVGKTTLVTNVYKEVAESCHFDCAAWVSVSKNFTREDLLRRVFKELHRNIDGVVPRDVDDMSYHSLVKALQGLLSEKRYLVLLDDVWNADAWEDADMECPRHLEDWALKILDKCCGLPLAIVSVGNLLALKEKTEFAWKNVHDSLVWDETTDQGQGVGQVSSILNLSIDDLPYHLKRCFLYCSIYPEDFFIKRKILIRMWMAEGYVEGKKHATMEDVADDYLNQLVQRSLLQAVMKNEFGRAKRFQIHDLIRELIVSRSAKEGLMVFSKCTAEFKTNSNVRHLILDRCVSGNFPTPNMTSVRSFHAFKTDLDASLLSRFRLLTVLNLWYTAINKLPSAVTNLLNLHYLGLRSTLIEELPQEVGRLHKLQTLDAKWSMVHSLPSSITKLKGLRHLILFRRHDAEFTFPGKAVVLPDGMKNLTCLQTLKYIEADEKVIISLGSLRQMRSLELYGVHESSLVHLPSSISKMSHLICLGIVSRDANVQLNLDSFSPPPLKLQKLTLKGTLIRCKLPSWFDCLSSLMELRLHSSELKEDSIRLLSSLPRLFDLSLWDAYKEKKMTFSEGGFPVLRRLRLEGLRSLAHLEFQKGSLVALQKLMLRQCAELIEIPQGIENLIHLENLELFEMPNELTRKIQEGQESGGDHQNYEHTTIVKVIQVHDGRWFEKKIDTNLCTLPKQGI